MTFSVMLVKDDQPRLVGTVWADGQANAEAMVPMVCGCSEGESVRVSRTEDREIPLRVAAAESAHFGH